MRQDRTRRRELRRPWRVGRVGVLAAWLVVAPPGLPRAVANPEGEQVVVGEASFLRDAAGQRLDIHTVTDLTVVDFDQAGVEAGEALNVFQPTDAVSQFWARDGSGRETHIDGSVWSNAQVGYLNPYGIFLGGEALLDVSTFVAGAGEVSNEDLRAGRLHFHDLAGEVGVAAGAEILASDAVLLVGRRVANYGHIRAPGGMVAFAAGNEVLLSEIDGHLRVRAEAPGIDPNAWAIEQAGHVDAPGGYVSLTAGDHYSLALNHSGITRARDIELVGGAGGLVEASGRLDASDASAGARGGSVRVLGERVALRGAKVDASGEAGGGEIRLGGDVRGGDALPAARRSYVSADSTLRADALGEGGGGSVVVWARERTGFFGAISARGGPRGGDGGFAEVSGSALTAPGGVDLGAAQGRSGTLLYDPTDILIEGGTPDPALDPDLPSSGEIHYDTADDADALFRISEHALENTDANILLEATNSITVSGTFAANPEEASAGVQIVAGNSLTLRTRNNANDQPAEGRTPGIDLVSGVDPGSDAPIFRTTEGDISLESGAGGSSSDVEAPIRVEGLEAYGGFVDLVANNAGESGGEAAGGVHAERLLGRGGAEDSANVGSLGVSISVSVGDIVVGEIITDGFGPQGGEGSESPAAEAGGNVSLQASQGDVTLRSVSARGGDADDILRGRGGAGARVSIEATGDETGAGGNVSVAVPDGSGGSFGIDASGGDGVLAVRESGEGDTAVTELVGGQGGVGGTVIINGSGRVRVGDVVADGGRSAPGPGGVPDIDGTGLDEALYHASAGWGGSIFIDGGAAASEESEPGAGDATADVPVSLVGNLSVVGGAGLGDFAFKANPDSETQELGIAGGTGGILRVAGEGAVCLGVDCALPEPERVVQAVVLDASGGDSERGRGGSARSDSAAILVGGDAESAVGDISAYASLRANGGQGIDGGAGGWVELRSAQASVLQEDAGGRGVEVNGGASTGGAGGVIPVSFQLFFDDVGGNPGFFVAEAGTDLTLGSVSARGGSSQTGRGGGERLNVGSTIFLRPGIDGSVETPRGDLRVTGLLDVSGGDGDGVYQPSDLVPEAGGGELEPPVGSGSAGHILIQAGPGSVALSGGARGVAGSVPAAPAEPCQADCPGSAGVAGFLDIVAENAVSADGLQAGFSEIWVQQRSAEASTSLTDDQFQTLLSVDGAAPAVEGQPQHQSVTVLSSPDDFGALHYLLNVPAPELAEGEGAEQDPEPPEVEIRLARGLGVLGSTAEIRRHSIVNQNGRIAGNAEGSGAHLELAGALHLEALDVVDLEVRGAGAEGSPEGTLALVVGADTDGSGGEVSVDVSRALAALEVEQREAGATIAVTGVATLSAVAGEAGQLTLSAARNPAGMSLLLGLTPSDGSTAQLHVSGGAVDVQGDLLLRSSGALVLEEDAIAATSAVTVALSAADDIDAAPANRGTSIAGAGTLLLETRDAGNASVAMRGVEVLAADVAGDLVIDFSGTSLVQQRLEISHGAVGAVNPLKLDLSGVEAGGVVALTDAETSQDLGILLGSSGEDAPIGVWSGGNQVYAAARLEISNVHDDPEAEGASLNDAELVSTGGSIEFTGPVDTAQGVATPARLVIESAGATTFGGNVGAERAFARLQTSDVNLGASEIRRFEADELAFLGRIDGAGRGVFLASGAEVEGQGGTLVFAGDIGTATALAGLEASADLIEFSGAERVVVGAGGIALNTDRTREAVPEVATVADTQGNIAFETSGDFQLGRFQDAQPEALGDVEKFSALGELRIQAESVRVGDLSADSISISTTHLTAVGRSPGNVLQTDGTSTPDEGVDWVANDIAANSAILEDPEARAADLAPIKLVIGSGGVSVPESFVGVEVVRFGDDIAAVKTSSFLGPEGQTLDLTGNGPRLIGVPTREIPRPEPAVEPFTPPRFGNEAPAPALSANAPEVLALLDCAAGECLEAEFMLSHPRRGPLATPRAAEIARQYREHVASASARAHLRAGFQVAGEAFGQAYPGAALSGEDFYRFLARSNLHAGPRADLDNLAELFAQVDLLGLPAPDAALVQLRLARDFARAAALPGFESPAVVAAVETSPVGLLR